MAVKEVHGPGPRGARGPRPKVENPGKLLKRIMDEVFRNYLPHCILVLICIVVSALANVQASLFLQTLMDDYILFQVLCSIAEVILLLVLISE